MTLSRTEQWLETTVLTPGVVPVTSPRPSAMLTRGDSLRPY